MDSLSMAQQANPKARLTSLFQTDGSAQAQGNDALRYVAPKEPSRQPSAPAAVAPPSTSSTNNNNSSIIYSTTVALYQYDKSARKYVQMGDASSNNMSIGCVIVGSNTSYNLLFYNAQKQHVAALPITFTTLKLMTLQDKRYINFYDEQGTNWSIKCTSDDQITEIMKHLFLTKIHVEIWGSDKTFMSKPNANTQLITEDLVFTTKDDQGVANGDTVAVAFSCWRVVGTATSAPNDIVTKYAPFESCSSKDLRKIRLGDGNERIVALEEGIVGMKKGGKRMILAPPGKTNQQDWYLIEVHVVKTKTGSSASTNSRSKSMASPSPADAASSPAPTEARRSSSSRRRSAMPATADLVPFDEQASKDEMELRELRLLQKEKQLEIQAKALEQAKRGLGSDPMPSASSGMGAFAPAPTPYGNMMGVGGYSGFGLMNPPGGGSLLSTTGRPLDGLIMELHAKVDYLIRMAPGSNSTTSSLGSVGGAADVASVIRGVERLAGENERLLLQINSQTQQYTSYEKRCDELIKQNQRLQEEKRLADEKYQSMASQQLQFNAEIANLTSARDAAITQTNRLHAEYQQLLTAYYQKQQGANEADEQKQALAFEREARMRMESNLDKEVKTRSLREQELQIVKKECEVVKKLRESEVSTLQTELQHVKLQVEQEIATKTQQCRQELTQKFAKQHDELHQTLVQKQSEVEALQHQVATYEHERLTLQNQLVDAQQHAETLQNAVTTAEQAQSNASSVKHPDAEERQMYQEQIELLQQRVQELEAEQFRRVQHDLDSGRLSSPRASPRRHSTSLETECASCQTQTAALQAKEEAAERTLAMAEAIKRDAEALLAEKPKDDMQRDRLLALLKDAVNDMFFRFQDFFEESAGLDGKQVLSIIRKVLKQHTKEIVTRFNEEEQAQETQETQEEEGDEPPPPPQLQEEATAKGEEEYRGQEEDTLFGFNKLPSVMTAAQLMAQQDQEEEEEEEDQEHASDFE